MVSYSYMKKKTKKPAKASKSAKKEAPANDIRALTKVSGGASYAITLPREIVKRFKWKERQKLKLDVDEKRQTITIKGLKK